MSEPFFIFEATQRCNNKCKYCYNVWKQDETYSRGELPAERIRSLFEKLFSECRPRSVTLAGGEPLLHPEIFEIASFLHTKKVETGIATNGLLLTQQAIRALLDNGVRQFEISLPSVQEQTYSMLCDSSRLKDVKNAILESKKHGASLTLAFVVTKINKDEVVEMISFASVCGADRLALNRFVPGGAGLKNKTLLALDQADLEKVLSLADLEGSRQGLAVDVTIPVENCRIQHALYPHLRFSACVCAQDKWVIDPMGNLRICEQNADIVGNLFQESFENLAHSSEVKKFRTKNLTLDCNACNHYNAHCGGGCRFLIN